MQKVEGSSPFSRFKNIPASTGFGAPIFPESIDSEGRAYADLRWSRFKDRGLVALASGPVTASIITVRRDRAWEVAAYSGAAESQMRQTTA